MGLFDRFRKTAAEHDDAAKDAIDELADDDTE
jgi:hypothetical protein